MAKTTYSVKELCALRTDRVIDDASINLMTVELAANIGFSSHGPENAIGLLRLATRYQQHQATKEGQWQENFYDNHLAVFRNEVDTNRLAGGFTSPIVASGKVIPHGARVIRIGAKQAVPKGAVYIGPAVPTEKHHQCLRHRHPELLGGPVEPSSQSSNVYFRTNLKNAHWRCRSPATDKTRKLAVQHVYDASRTNPDNPYSATGFFPETRATTSRLK